MRIACALVVFFMVPCSSAWAVEEPDYFPLQIGNTWTYVDSNRTPPFAFTVAITDTQRVEGQTYYAFQGMSLLLGGLGPQSLYRKDERGDVFVYYQEEQRDCLRFRFSGVLSVVGTRFLDDAWLDPCDSRFEQDFWTSLPPSVVHDLWLSEALGLASQFFARETEAVSLQSPQGYVHIIFVPGIGIVYVAPELAYPVRIIDAIIGGKRISQTTLVPSTSWGTVKCQVQSEEE